MVSTKPKAMMGVGLYTPAQAAHLARVPTQTLTRWVHGNASGAAAIRAQLPRDDGRWVTFLDLVQAMAIRAIRIERRVPLQKLREFVDRAESEFGVSYPFARQHQTFLFDDDIVLRQGEHLIQLTGKYKRQDLIRPVVELYMDDLSFADGLASRYRPFADGEREIRIDPHQRMGQPILFPCGYSVQSLVEAVRTEGSIAAAAAANAGAEAGGRSRHRGDRSGRPHRTQV